MNFLNVLKMSDYLQNLNKQQLEAVSHKDGPILILAGAGTGKTRVLTTRIVHLIKEHNVNPSNILAVTFTNKASQEMKKRVASLLGNLSSQIWIGTFHSIAAKLIREHHMHLGLSRNFIIIDPDDQKKLIANIIQEKFPGQTKADLLPVTKTAIYVINRLKDKAIFYDSIPHSEMKDFMKYGDISEIYRAYQEQLSNLDSVDFGDLLLFSLKLFRENSPLCTEYQDKFRYILVDEYQDTNIAQYVWLKILAGIRQNICCVGDDDQSIYGWRGAEVTNILRFDKDYKEAKIVRLEENYRSTQNILSVASNIIACNTERHGKSLWSSKKSDNTVKLSVFRNDKTEAVSIADEIDARARLYKTSYKEMAILVRASYQTRIFEESLNLLRIPYQIIGGMKFYDRAEIKDVLAYIRLFINRRDNMAFERVVNTPKRGLGKSSIDAIHQISRDNNCSMFDGASIYSTIASGKSKIVLKTFIETFLNIDQQVGSLSNMECIKMLLETSGYIEMLESEKTEESKDRLDNIRELIKSISEFETLDNYLEHVSLITDIDSSNNDNKVNIMTIHAAKGLEFHTVFLPGFEEGILPSTQAIKDFTGRAIEEERRLAYVAVTRARENLFISYSCYRRIYNSSQYTTPSRFLDEIPKECYDFVNDNRY